MAITNRRIVSVNNTGGGGEPTVTFRYRPSGSRQWRLSTVTVMEFMRRFLQHVLPKGFVKVRYYGFFSPGQRGLLRQIMAWLKPQEILPPEKQKKAAQNPVTMQPVEQRCPLCDQPLRLVGVLQPQPLSLAVLARWQPP